MPLMDPADATATAAAKTQRRQNRQTGTDGDDKITPISEAQMLGLPQAQVIHGLPLVFKCPPMRQALEQQQAIYEEWPDVFLYAAVGERSGTGISLPVVLQMWQTARENLVAANNGADDASIPPPVTREDIVQQLRAFGANADELVTRLAPTIWPLVSRTPGLRWPRPEPVEGETPEALPAGVEYLDDALLQRFTVPALTDLLRALLDTLGGFPGDAGDRFF